MRKTRRSKREQAALTRDRLVQAASAVFAMKGYDDATVEDVCLAAGRARGAFYLHFRSRSEVFLAALRDGASHPRILLDALARAGRPGGNAAALREALAARLPEPGDFPGLLALGRGLQEAARSAASGAAGRRKRAA